MTGMDTDLVALVREHNPTAPSDLVEDLAVAMARVAREGGPEAETDCGCYMHSWVRAERARDGETP